MPGMFELSFLRPVFACIDFFLPRVPPTTKRSKEIVMLSLRRDATTASWINSEQSFTPLFLIHGSSFVCEEGYCDGRGMFTAPKCRGRPEGKCALLLTDFPGLFAFRFGAIHTFVA